MNKKFSTLVAGLLLAASLGTVGAATPDYSKFTVPGTNATTLKQNGAFQLADGEGNVLAMVKEADGKLVLKMVAANSGVNLAETLWTIRWTTYDDTVKKYYFTFESAAYHMPLSFSTENAGKDGLTSEINYEFPGKIGTWEWQEGIEGAGISGAAALKYRFDNPDSVMTLAANTDNVVGAIKYAQSKGTRNALALRPVVVQEVVLTADDLNSTMLSNTKAGKFRLGFFGDVKGSTIGNMWTANDLIAEPVVAYSTSMYTNGEVSAEDPYNANQKAAAQAAKAAADALLVPATVEGAVQEAIAGGTAWDQVAKDWAATVKAAATTDENTFAASLTAVQETVAAKDAEVKEAAALAAAATAINTEVAAYDMSAITGVANTKAAVEAIITGATTAGTDLQTAAGTDNKTAFDALFTTKVTMADNNAEEYAASVEAVKALAAKFQALTVFDNITDASGLALWLNNGVDAEIKAFVTTMTTGLTTTVAIQTEVDKLIAAAGKITTAIELPANAFVAAEPAWDLPKFKEEYAKLAYTQNDDYTEAQFDAVKSAISDLIDALPTAIDAAEQGKKVVADQKKVYGDASTDAAKFSDAVTGINEAIAAMNSAKTVKDAITASVVDFDKEGRDIATEINAAVAGENLVAAVESVNIDEYLAPGSENAEVINEDVVANYVSLYLGKGTGVNKQYLAVDTNLLTGVSGNRHLKFAAWKYNGGIKNSDGELLSNANVPLFRDYNGHFNFKFTYYPTEDSLKIETDGYAMKPAVGVENWVDIPSNKVVETYDYPANGKFVKLVVLADNHKEVTVGEYEPITGSEDETINTRIGFGINFKDYVAIPAGVYTIKFVSNDKNKELINGRYITYNWLSLGAQVLASAEDQELNHIPAAQWIVTQAKGENLNSIVNRESAQPLVYTNEFGDVQQQYMFATGTKNLYTNMAGDSLLFTAVPEEFTTSKTVGYFIDPEKNEEADDQLRVFSLKYLNDLNDDLFVGYNEADSILNVAKTDAEDMVYFRLIRATDSLSYGASAKGIAEQLKRIAYYLQLETPNKNIKDEDKLFITVDKDGKYKLINSTLTNGKVNYKNINAFFLKEFKEADSHYYALIEKGIYVDGKWYYNALGEHKISVKDYPSILVREFLEGENMPIFEYNTYSYRYTDGRTSTFGLVAKDAPKYRRLGVTNAEDGLNNLGTNVAKINITREDNRYLYENTTNKVAGYEADPTGINYLGALFDGADKAAMFIDTAYVRNETARPQYLLGLRPNFDPDTTFCPVDHGHPYELVDQVRAYYMVTLSDSVAAYAGNKPMMDKFMYENRTYTRLAFVDAVHQGDLLVIMSSKFKGTKNAENDTIDLSKNAFNNAAVQFRLTKNDDPTAEFYIETQPNEFVRLINGVAVLTNDIADAERFNIAKTDDKPVANEGIAASEVSVIAGNGTITVKGAAGKKVAISNILGQTIANTVVTSDEATIAAPAGVVVVAIEGEAAVKAIVK